MSDKPLLSTTKEFGSLTSIHGVFYVFSRGIPWIDQLVWGFLLILSIALAGIMFQQSYSNWRENPVITSLAETSRSVKNMSYLAITICSEGLNMIAVDRVIQRNFEIWKQDNKRRKRDIKCGDEKEQFLKEKFQILTENQKIFNIIQKKL